MKARYYSMTVWFGLFALVMLAGCGGPVFVAGSEAGSSGQVLGFQESADLDDGGDCLGTTEAGSAVHIELFNRLNTYRVENGLSPLSYSSTLQAAADAHCRDLWERDFFAHINPDGMNPGDRAVAAGFCHQYVGENLAAGQNTLARVMQAWKESPTHNANMLVPEYVHGAIGHFTDPTGRQYYAQLFAYDLP